MSLEPTKKTKGFDDVNDDLQQTDRWWETHQVIIDTTTERSPLDNRLVRGMALHLGISLEEARDRLYEYAVMAGRAQKALARLLAD